MSQEAQSQSVVTDLSRFLLKTDLLLSRLAHFNDRPESFATWRAIYERTPSYRI